MFLQIFHEFRMFRRPTAVIDSLNIELQQGIPDVVRTAVLSGMSGKEQPHFLCLPIALQMLDTGMTVFLTVHSQPRDHIQIGTERLDKRQAPLAGKGPVQSGDVDNLHAIKLFRFFLCAAIPLHDHF